MIKSHRFIIILTIALLFMVRFSKAQDGQKGSDDILQANVKYAAEDYRDPFKALIFGEGQGEIEISDAPLPALAAQGIIWGGKIPQAIINNQVVKIGDTIEGAEIVDIDQDGIILFFQNKQHRLSTPGGNTDADK